MSIIIPEELDKKFKEGKSPATIKTYKSMLYKFFNECFDTDTYSMNKLMDFNKVLKYLDGLSITSVKLISIATVMLLKAANAPQTLIDKYGRVARFSRVKDIEERIRRPTTEEEDESYIPWEQILNIREQYERSLTDKKYTKGMTELEYQRFYMRYVVLSLFTMIPPQRGQIYFNCYLDKNVEGSNYVDLAKGTLNIREYKTKRSYGERIMQLPKKLVSILKAWKKINNCKDNLLICNANGNMMSTQSFTQFTNSIFNRNISTDMIRKTYITHMVENVGITGRERDELAIAMGHSQKVQGDFYIKDFIK